jgi:hypothetical protein
MGFNLLSLQIRRDFGELDESMLEVFEDFGGKNVSIRKIADLTIQQHVRAGTPPGGLHWSHGEATERLGNRESM